MIQPESGSKPTGIETKRVVNQDDWYPDDQIKKYGDTKSAISVESKLISECAVRRG